MAAVETVDVESMPNPRVRQFSATNEVDFLNILHELPVGMIQTIQTL